VVFVRVRLAVMVALACGGACAADADSADTGRPQVIAQARKLAAEPAVAPPHGHRVAEDRSGRKQVGQASVYAARLQGRRMAGGARLDQRGNAAASKTLPIGTVAKVTNTRTGQTATVRVLDHGPFVDGRTLDVTRATAAQLGITRHDGVAPVVVAPVAVPQKDGTIKVGAGAIPGPATAR
jgi:rare lipoprotein A